MKRKTVAFDLSIKMLKRYYPGKHYRQAYHDIQKYMEEHGFRHKQFSGYISKEPMSRVIAEEHVDGFISQNPWILPCIKDLDITSDTGFNLGEMYKRHEAEFKEFERKRVQKAVSKRHEPKRRRPMKEVMAEAQKEADEYNARLGIRPISKDDLEL